MNGNFEQCLALTLKEEGGYVNNPSDPGGPTNLGVTQGTWEKWVGHLVDQAAMKALGPADVAPLYRKNYWDAIRGDDLPLGVDFACFDFAVNYGPVRVIKILQKLIGVTPDGIIGEITLSAIEASDHRTLAVQICEERLRFLQTKPTWGIFAKGWSRRVAEVEKLAFDMVG